MKQAIILSFFVLGLAACGRPSGISGDQVTAEAVKPTFKSLQQNLFIPKCMHCHSGEKAPHGIRVTSYEDILYNPMFPPLVVPGRPESSDLYIVVRDGSMPKKDTPASPEVVRALYTWIKMGAPKNENTAGATPSPTPHITAPGCDPGEPGCE